MFLFLIIVLILCCLFYLKFVVFNYWNKIKIPHTPPTIGLGNIDLDFLLDKTTIGDLVKLQYEKFKDSKFFGIYIFHNPILVVNDPDLIKSILVKDFHHFADRGIHSNLKVDPMSFNLFRLPGERWKQLRTKLTPIFTSGKLKQLYPLLSEVSDVLVGICDESLKYENIMDVKDIVERFITDCISTVAFGFNCNSLKNPSNEFRNFGKLGTDMGKYTAVLSIFGSNILDFFHVPVFKKSVNNFFINIFKNVVEQRLSEKISRNDFINLLMDVTDHSQASLTKIDETHDTSKLSVIEAAAQVFVFFIAGFETTSTTLTYCLHELAKQPEIQNNLQEEIDEVSKSPRGFDYDNVMNMKYLDMVFCEAMRKHPAVPFINRVCTKNYMIPETDICIPKGMQLAISVSGLQNDPNIYPEPEIFDPQRFTKENCNKRNSYFFLPFGEGPRICIGKRVALMQGKIALVTLLSKYRFTLCDKTLEPLPYSNRTFLQVTDDPLYLKVCAR